MKVEAVNAGKRIDAFIKETLPDVSRQRVKTAFSEGEIYLNGKRARKGLLLREGDRVQIRRLVSKKDITYQPNQVIGPRIIYESENIAAIYKPPFMHTYPKRKGELDTLANFVNHTYPLSNDDEFLFPPLFLSRLDYETSGVVLFARDGCTYERLKDLQNEGKIIKSYALVCKGRLERDLVVKNSIVTSGSGKVKVDRESENGSDTYHTRFSPEQNLGDVTLVKAEIKKGRMHQIRAHAAYVGYPILGDLKYGGGSIPEMEGLPLRPLLHSASVEFPMSDSGNSIRVNCPYPEDLIRVLRLLQSHSGR